MTGALETCPGCLGAGEWITYCCNGAGGCSCRGGEVPMGTCNVCGGTGQIGPEHDPRANISAIGGMCFTGSGPSSGFWSDKPAMGLPGRKP